MASGQKYILIVEYGTGKISTPTKHSDLLLALKEFAQEYQAALPDTKMYGLPPILKAEILPLAYHKEEEGNSNG